MPGHYQTTFTITGPGKPGMDLLSEVEKHIATSISDQFGGGNRDPKDILRIHMAWCDQEKLILIGHCGEHLGNATS